METAELPAQLQDQSKTEVQIGKQETKIFKQEIHKDQRKEKYRKGNRRYIQGNSTDRETVVSGLKM